MIHADESISENCVNLYDSYGEICVQCNCCGKLNKDTMHECRIQTYKEHLMNTAKDIGNRYYNSESQKKNILKSIVTIACDIAKEYGFDVNEIKGE